MSDISFNFEEIKTGRTITSLKFYIHSNKSNNNAKEEACTTLEGKSTNEEEKYSTELINAVKSRYLKRT